VTAFVRARTLTDRGTDAFTQATLAEFMRQGLLASHIRRMRTEYARRRDALLAAMRRHVTRATPLAAPGGLHMVLRLPDGTDEAAVVRAGAARDLALAPLHAYYVGAPRMAGLVIGFAATPAAMANDVAKRLEAILAHTADRAVA
jgi:GntR family transcriptional regulator / MocR family aminotransferase